MKTHVAFWVVMVALGSGCVQGGPLAVEGGSAAVTGRDWAAEVSAVTARGALMVGERARAETSAEQPVWAYRFRSRDIWVVDVTAIAVDGGDPAVAVLGPLSAEGEAPLLAESDERHGPFERLTRVDLEYDREYLAVVAGAPGLTLETQITTAEDAPATFELPSFVLGEPAGAEPAQAAWERACASEEARLRAELGVNRFSSFDCGAAEPFDAGGVAALGSTAVARFTTTWFQRRGESYTGIIGLAGTDRRAAFESHRQRCQSFLEDARRSLGVVYAGAACGTPTEVVEAGRSRWESDVAYFVFARE